MDSCHPKRWCMGLAGVRHGASASSQSCSCCCVCPCCSCHDTCFRCNHAAKCACYSTAACSPDVFASFRLSPRAQTPTDSAACTALHVPLRRAQHCCAWPAAPAAAAKLLRMLRTRAPSLRPRGSRAPRHLARHQRGQHVGAGHVRGRHARVQRQLHTGGAGGQCDVLTRCFERRSDQERGAAGVVQYCWRPTAEGWANNRRRPATTVGMAKMSQQHALCQSPGLPKRCGTPLMVPPPPPLTHLHGLHDGRGEDGQVAGRERADGAAHAHHRLHLRAAGGEGRGGRGGRQRRARPLAVGGVGCCCGPRGRHPQAAVAAQDEVHAWGLWRWELR